MLVVCGMHRSGTSAMTFALRTLGIALGDNLIAPATDNPKGFWEDKDFVSLNDGILAHFGQTWDSLAPQQTRDLADAGLNPHRVRARELLERKLTGMDWLGIKDPRIARLLPFWLPVIEELGLEVRFLLSFRDPLSVARSLALRNGFPDAKSHYLWLQHVIPALVDTAGHRRACLDFDDLISRPDAEIRRIARELGFADRIDEGLLRHYCSDYLDQGLLHARCDEESLAQDPSLPELVRELYQTLRLVATGASSLEDAAVRSILGSSREWMEDLAGLLALAATDERKSRARQEQCTGLEQKYVALHTKFTNREQNITHLVAEVERQDREILKLHGMIRERDHQIGRLQPLIAEREAMLASLSWRSTRPLRAVAGILGGNSAYRQQTTAMLGRLTRKLPRLATQEPPMPEPTSAPMAQVPKHPEPTRNPPRPAASGANPTRLLRIARGLLSGDPAYRERLREMISPVLGPLRKQASTLAAVTRSIGTEGADVVYVSGESHTPGHHYRVERYADAARSTGLRTKIIRFADWEGHTSDFAGARIVVIWRLAWSAKVASIIGAARAQGAQLIFDVDDLMFVPELARVSIIDGIRSQGLAEQMVADSYLEVRKVLASSDLCTTTTDELARYAQQAGRPTLVLPNGYDDNTFAVSRAAARRCAQQRSDGLLRIGYAGGSRTHQRDFELCAGAVATVLRERPDVRLVLFHSSAAGQQLVDLAEFPVFKGLEDRVEWRELVPLERLPEEVARFDVNLAPLEVGNPFCEAKSELKFFEAALAGVCTVASPTGPFRRAMQHGETGFLAETPQEWLDALNALLDDKGLRERMAQSALHDVLWPFGPDRRAQAMATLLQLLRGGREAAMAFAQLLQADHQSRPAEVPEHRTLFRSDRYGLAEVTVVVPLHNYADVVEEALESVRQQTLTQIDLIVIDDASIDDSAAVVTRWAERHAAHFNRILILQNCENAGLGHTRNAGFAQADTLYVLPLDADNRLLPECAERCLATIRAQRAAFAYPVIRQFGNCTDIVGEHPYDPMRLTFGNYIDAMALISKLAWTLVGGYDHVRFGWEDYEFWCKLAERGLYGVAVGGEPLAEYRVHGASMLRTMTDVKDNKRRLVDDMLGRHPWLRLDYSVIQSPGTLAALPPSDVPISVPREKPIGVSGDGPSDDPINDDRVVGGADRLAELLPMLRCPETGLALSLADNALVTKDGSRCWPIIRGRALLFPGMSNPAIHDDGHISNPLPPHVVQRVRNTPGMVLNLSAGGTIERLPHVVEAEAAIFRHTDVVADSHHLPFADAVFEGVVSLNAFEHYADPLRAAAEIRRVLKPGGWLLLHTAFLQPEHEAPWHFYNCTRQGLARWFSEFEIESIHVSDNLNPVYALSWLASECETALAADVSPTASQHFRSAPVGDLVTAWRDPSTRDNDLWNNFMHVSQQRQQGIAAGFELIARRPHE